MAIEQRLTHAQQLLRRDSIGDREIFVPGNSSHPIPDAGPQMPTLQKRAPFRPVKPGIGRRIVRIAGRPTCLVIERKGEKHHDDWPQGDELTDDPLRVNRLPRIDTLLKRIARRLYSWFGPNGSGNPKPVTRICRFRPEPKFVPHGIEFESVLLLFKKILLVF